VSVLDFHVTRRHPQLVAFVDQLQRKNAEALSFYPRQVFERESEKGRIFLGLLNNQPCGYLYAGACGGDVKLHQVCIEYDARRRLYGAHLVGAMESWAENGQSRSITLRCGFDLDANEFWKSLDYRCIGKQAGGVRRMRTINIWRKALQPELLAATDVEPAVGVVDASLWRKHKRVGVVTQFARGRAMDAYREEVVSMARAKEVEE
jgi:hypothetical protein